MQATPNMPIFYQFNLLIIKHLLCLLQIATHCLCHVDPVIQITQSSAYRPVESCVIFCGLGAEKLSQPQVEEKRQTKGEGKFNDSTESNSIERKTITMKKLLLSAVSFAVVAVTAMVSAPTTSEAVPSFMRQTGAACLSCHFQAIPRLSPFGRAFSMTGMRDMGEAGVIEDDHLSLPAQFHGSFLMKVLIRNQTGLVGVGQNTGIMIPDESALFVGGRYGEHVGALTEISMNGGGAGVAQAKLNYAMDIDSGVVMLHMVSGDVGLGVLFSDPSNTVRHTNRSSIQRAMALEKTQMMKGSVTGFMLSAFLNDSIYLAAAAYAAVDPGSTTGNWGSLDNINPYLRGAYIAELGGLEAIVGAWWTNVSPGIHSGNAAAAAALSNSGSAKQYGVDLQLQGDVGDLSVGFYLPYVIKGEQIALAGGVPTADITGFQAMLTVAFGHFGINLGYDYMKTKSIGTSMSAKMKSPLIGAWYSVAQNVELIIAHQIMKVTPAVVTLLTPATTTNRTTMVVEYVY